MDKKQTAPKSFDCLWGGKSLDDAIKKAYKNAFIPQILDFFLPFFYSAGN
jgi:hypothetical protein